ncbi:sodium/bile acid cotransporter-like [Teleopsis dalmanni]|uniref:sodium/bile acid cotransporter-like n=1 Tax=Teleopsis dalmanni TaxID=139649 RepID=UPI0018CDF79F|nr:sodium/bile acid cotransporter-like [Teleopsis dalmanni]
MKVDVNFYKRNILSSLTFVWLLTNQINRIKAEYGKVAGDWQVIYGQQEMCMLSNSLREVSLSITNVDLTDNVDFYFKVNIENTKLAKCDARIQKSELERLESSSNLAAWHGVVQVQGFYFGYTHLYVTLHPVVGLVEFATNKLNITLVREHNIDNKIFTYSAAAVVLLMFVNLGTALDLQRFKSIVFKPIGPLVGIATRYIIMPALGLGLGFLLFKQYEELQLALFFTALSPSGGLANICTVFLKGNLNLSVATTTVNTLLALAMFPFWILLLASVIHNNTNMAVPFMDLAVSSIGLILALMLGVVLRICIPKTTKFVFRFLKPVSVLLSLCLVGLTVALNAFIFKELTFMIFLAGTLLPLIGYVLSYGLSKVFCRSTTDSLTIGIETSVLNMTIPILLLQHSLEEPKSDMAIVVPIITALISIGLALIFYIVRRILGWNTKLDADAFDENELLIVD